MAQCQAKRQKLENYISTRVQSQGSFFGSLLSFWGYSVVGDNVLFLTCSKILKSSVEKVDEEVAVLCSFICEQPFEKVPC